MPSIGVRELKNQASEIVRHVREEGVQYVVTYRGEPVGVLAPVDNERLEEMTAQIAATEGVAATLKANLQTQTGYAVKLVGQIEASAADLEELRRRAMALAGQFHAGVDDLADEHDRYLAESASS